MSWRTVAVDPTLVNLIQSCHYKFYLSYIKCLTLPGEDPDYIQRGDLMHRFLKYLYRHFHEGNRVDKAIEFGLAFTVDKKDKATGLIVPAEFTLLESEVEETVELFKLYCKYYEDEVIYPLAVEEPFSIILYENEEEQLRILLEGIIDLIVDNRGHRELWDHKTAAQNRQPGPFVNQNLGYCAATGLTQVYINQIGTQNLYKKSGERSSRQDNERFKRWPISYPSQIVERWKLNTIRTVKDMLFSLDTGEYPQNLTSCDKYFKPCAFLQLCLTEPELRGWKAGRDYITKERWDPLARDKKELVG